jgi:hypothetical protein
MLLLSVPHPMSVSFMVETQTNKEVESRFALTKNGQVVRCIYIR